jgi:hypothetical protein
VKATVISSRGATKEEAQDWWVQRCWGSEQNRFRTFKVIQRGQRQCRWSPTCSLGNSIQFCSFLTSFVIISLHWFPCVQVCSSTSSSSWPTATTPHPAEAFLTICHCNEQHCKHVWSLTGATTCSQGQWSHSTTKLHSSTTWLTVCWFTLATQQSWSG